MAGQLASNDGDCSGGGLNRAISREILAFLTIFWLTSAVGKSIMCLDE